MNKLTNFWLGTITVILGIIAFRMYAKPQPVNAAVGKRYEYKMVWLTGSSKSGCDWNLNDVQADGKEGWQVVGITGGSYGSGGYTTANCYVALEMR
jgi:hypothetical protein